MLETEIPDSIHLVVEQEDAGSSRIIPNLSRRSLHVRLQAVSKADSRFKDPAVEINHLFHRRFIDAAIRTLISGQYSEKTYTTAVCSALTNALRVKALPYDAFDFSMTVLNDVASKFQLFGDKYLAIDVCLILLDTFVQNSLIDSPPSSSSSLLSSSLSFKNDELVAVIDLASNISKCDVVQSSDQKSKWVTGCLFFCGEILEADNIMHNKSRMIVVKCMSKLVCLLGKSATLLQSVASIWINSAFTSSLSIFYAIIFSTKVTIIRTSAESVMNRVKLFLLNELTKKVFGPKQPAEYRIVEALKPFLECLTVTDWLSTINLDSTDDGKTASPEESLESLVLRTVKKSPEGASAALETLVGSIGMKNGSLFNFSRLLTEGGSGALLRILRTTDEQVEMLSCVDWFSIVSH